AVRGLLRVLHDLGPRRPVADAGQVRPPVGAGETADRLHRRRLAAPGVPLVQGQTATQGRRRADATTVVQGGLPMEAGPGAVVGRRAGLDGPVPVVSSWPAATGGDPTCR